MVSIDRLIWLAILIVLLIGLLFGWHLLNT
jgi:hypothetical protein